MHLIVLALEGLCVDTEFPVAGPKAPQGVLDALAAAGVLGIIRTVPLPGVSPADDITAAELAAILAHPARFWVAWYQHPRFPGWDPGLFSGKADATYAADYAHDVGFLDSTTGYADAEGMSSATTEAAAIGYYNDFGSALVAGGVSPGLYAGYDDAMNAVDLYALHDDHTYWSDAGNRKIAMRGTAILQGASKTIGGVKFDLNTVRKDMLGGLPSVMRAGTASMPVG